MKGLNEFDIAFVGLKNGSHTFFYRIADSFFNHFENSLVQKGNVKVELLLEKTSVMLVLNFAIQGEIETACDRCNEDFNLPINGTYTTYIKFFSDEPPTQEETDVVYISRNEDTLNTAQLIYEDIILSIPVRKVHPEKNGKPTCNEEVMKWLNEPKQKNEETIDPRWEKLKKLKF